MLSVGTPLSHLAMDFRIADSGRCAAVPHVHQGQQTYVAAIFCPCAQKKTVAVVMVSTKEIDALCESGDVYYVTVV